MLYKHTFQAMFIIPLRESHSALMALKAGRCRRRQNLWHVLGVLRSVASGIHKVVYYVVFLGFLALISRGNLET